MEPGFHLDFAAEFQDALIESKFRIIKKHLNMHLGYNHM